MVSVVILTLLAGAASWGVLWWSKKLDAQGQALAVAAEIPVAELNEDASAAAKELGPGSFRQEVKIRGVVGCDTPLVAELSHTLCVSYRFSVTREYEETLWEKDSNGNTTQRLVRRSEQVAANEVSTPFWLDDGSGRILVHPDRAKLDRTKSHASFQPAAYNGAQFGVGSFILNLSSHPGGTLGYRYEEHCLAVGTEVTVVGEVGDQGGQLALRKPEDKDAPFVISPKSFQELTRSNRTMVSVLRGVSIGLAAVAVLIFVLGVVR